MVPVYKNLPSAANPTLPPNRTAPSRPGDESDPSAPMFAPLRLILAASSWLRRSRIRFLFLLLCSPLLLPLLCATFPILCAAEICSRICSRIRRKAAPPREDEERLRRCEEGCGCQRVEIGLLQRYLEDQLMLVGSVYDCGDEIDEGGGDDDDLSGDRRQIDYRVPLLS